MTEQAGHQVRDRSTWSELFYDLVLVFAVTQAAALLTRQLGWVGLGSAMLILTPLWWAWVGMALLVNAVAETTGQRLLILVMAAVTLVAAAAAPGAFAGRGNALVFAFSYLVMRAVLGESMRRKASFPVVINPYTVGVASGVTYVAGAVLPVSGRAVVWATAVAVEIVSPVALGRRLHGMRFEPAHLAERFGILVIIALGESVVSAGVTASLAPLTPATLAAVIMAVILGAELWWMYFSFGASAIEHALRTHRTQALVVRDVLSYCHFILLLGLLLAAVGTREAVAHPGASGGVFTACLLPAGAAVFTLSFGLARWRMFGAASWTRVVTGLVLAALCLVTSQVPGLAGIAAVVAVLMGLNLVEYWLVASGRALPVIRRRAAA